MVPAQVEFLQIAKILFFSYDSFLILFVKLFSIKKSFSNEENSLLFGLKKLAEISLNPNKQRADHLRKLVLTDNSKSVNLKNKIKF